VRRLFILAAIALAGACEAPPAEEVGAALDGETQAGPNDFRAQSDEPPPYAGEWAISSDSCRNQRELWTIEENRMGMKRQRFCVFERVFSSTGGTGEGFSASARCLANGRESHDFVFFRVNPGRSAMRVTINDAESVELVRCPMRT
jgi:hypothetical protein